MPSLHATSVKVHLGPDGTCWVDGCRQAPSTCERVDHQEYVALCAPCFVRRRAEQRRAAMHVVSETTQPEGM